MSQNNCSPGFAVEAAKRFLGQYRHFEAHDPEGYAMSIALAFATFPEWVVEILAHPTRGLMTRHRRPPEVADVMMFGAQLIEPERKRLAAEARQGETQLLLAAPQLATQEERVRAFAVWQVMKAAAAGCAMPLRGATSTTATKADLQQQHADREEAERRVHVAKLEALMARKDDPVVLSEGLATRLRPHER
jgi:hypothetical protein